MPRRAHEVVAVKLLAPVYCGATNQTDAWLFFTLDAQVEDHPLPLFPIIWRRSSRSKGARDILRSTKNTYDLDTFSVRECLVEDYVVADRETADSGCKLIPAAAHLGITGEEVEAALNPTQERVRGVGAVIGDVAPDRLEITPRLELFGNPNHLGVLAGLPLSTSLPLDLLHVKLSVIRARKTLLDFVTERGELQLVNTLRVLPLLLFRQLG